MIPPNFFSKILKAREILIFIGRTGEGLKTGRFDLPPGNITGICHQSRLVIADKFYVLTTKLRYVVLGLSVFNPFKLT
jgi:hypothetical protein